MIDGHGEFSVVRKAPVNTQVETVIKVKAICRDCGQPMSYLSSHRNSYPDLLVCYNCNHGCELEISVP